ncbi:MAG: SDR family NAD(P)-dependent oxidoreductase, partial [Chloroflexota bacterium]
MGTMTGKRVMVTGATNGIGEVAAIELAGMGAAVTLVSRSEEKLAATAEKIRAAGSQDVDTIQADLSSIEQTRAAAAAYLSRHDRLDVLLNNAGAVFADRHDSIDGIEMTLALN